MIHCYTRSQLTWLEDYDEKIINEEYKIWKKNNPFLYDIIITHALEWPSLSIQWLPEKRDTADGDTVYRLVLGTHTSGHEQNYLMLAEVTIPAEAKEIAEAPKYDDSRKGMCPGQGQGDGADGQAQRWAGLAGWRLGWRSSSASATRGR